MPLPLEGIRVVDFSRVLAGPHCAKTLLDLGAEVVKLEPPGGDLSRLAFPNGGGISGYYCQQNAGKRNVSIDLNAPGARDVALRLCDTADVIVENFRPGALAAFGLDYESVSARNPGVVYASISGYGQHGPWRSRMAYAPTVQAETGITANTAEHFGRTQELRSDSLSHADVYSGLHAAIAILACLTERERTGAGQYVDVAMAAVMLSVNERVHVDLSDAELGAERPILGATDGPFFEGPHGEPFASPMSLVGSMSFPFYLAAMRRPDLGRDPRFLTPELRLRNLAALHRIVQEWIWTFGDMDALDAQLDEAKIATGRVRSVKEFADSDWAQTWHAVRTVSDRSGGQIKIPGRPWHFADQPEAGDDGQLAARQGEHNTEILTELGFSAGQIATLETAGALVEPGRTSLSQTGPGSCRQPTPLPRWARAPLGGPLRQPSASTMACKARPTPAPTTVPLIRMYCRSRPRSSSSWLDVSAASHRSMVPVTRPASSSWNWLASALAPDSTIRSRPSARRGSDPRRRPTAASVSASRRCSSESGSAAWARRVSLVFCHSDEDQSRSPALPSTSRLRRSPRSRSSGEVSRRSGSPRIHSSN
jgi:crotonobetainyl-CoA:carnitine CoA-transferase CaiB-like acyl-CoA transferase